MISKFLIFLALTISICHAFPYSGNVQRHLFSSLPHTNQQQQYYLILQPDLLQNDDVEFEPAAVSKRSINYERPIDLPLKRKMLARIGKRQMTLPARVG